MKKMAERELRELEAKRLLQLERKERELMAHEDELSKMHEAQI